jgi:hypothetical protein
MYLQEWLFREALAEAKIEHQKLLVKADHLNGRNLVGGLIFSLKYPTYFLREIEKLNSQKKHKYVFRGFVSPSGGRKEMLMPFVGPGSIIQHSVDGRNPRTKFRFQRNYFELMKSGHFSLCPNQKDWPGNPKNAWTYRFVEACFSKTLPICFRESPLGENFVNDFEFFWDDADHNLEHYDDKIHKNFNLVKKQFCLTQEEIESIKSLPWWGKQLNREQTGDMVADFGGDCGV